MKAYAINWYYDGRRSREVVEEYEGTFDPGERLVKVTPKVNRHFGFRAVTRRAKITIIDDSTEPARILREDHDVRTLRGLGAKLPTFLIDTKGNLCDPAGVLFHAP